MLKDIESYEEVQTVLREEIVNPLRENLFVRADRVMRLRERLEKLSSVTGLTSEEKDPEEFLNSLLAQILKAEPFLKVSLCSKGILLLVSQEIESSKFLELSLEKMWLVARRKSVLRALLLLC